MPLQSLWSEVPDAYDQWKQHDAEQNRWLEQLPVCADCDEHIQDDHYFEINGEYICPRCMEDLHRRDIDDLCL